MEWVGRTSDEGRHVGLVEEWTFSLWSADAALGATTTLIVRPDGSTWYSAALVRDDGLFLHLCEPDGPALRSVDSLLLKAEGLWAEHECESTFEQWTIANEAYAVALDAPDDALGSAYGRPEPIAFDWEWYATGAPIGVSGGYRQAGEVHAAIELRGASVKGVFAGSRTHRWGSWMPDGSTPSGPQRAPVVFDSRIVERVLDIGGWSTTL